MSTRAPSPSKGNRLVYYRELLKREIPRAPVQDPESLELILHFAYTYDVLYRDISKLLGPYGLSPSTLNLLSLLLRRDSRSCPLHELGDLLLVSRANVTGLVDNLAKKGLVERVSDPTDRRVRLARLTQEGEALLDQVLPHHESHVSELCQSLSEGDRKSLHRLLEKLCERVGDRP